MSIAKHSNSVNPCPACEEKLKTAHPDIAKWFRDHVKPRHNDCHIAWSHRDKAAQDKAFLDGKSKLKFPKSPHNSALSTALDLFELDFNGIGRWAFGYFRDIADECAQNGYAITWGGNFNGLADADHFEMAKDEK